MSRPPDPTLPPDTVDAIGQTVRRIAAELAGRYPGDAPDRQPVHTVYGGAHLFRRDTAVKLGQLALRSLDEYGPGAATFAAAIGLEGAAGSAGSAAGALAETVYSRVRDKLESEAVEDFRIDFEDGYGNRPDDEEDATAVDAATEVAAGMDDGTLPPFIGIRIKPFSGELYRRAVRTLDLFLTTLIERGGGVLPGNFVVTLPKPMVPQQVAALAAALDALEERLGLETGSVAVELMIEMPQAIVDVEGRCPLPELVAAADGRCVAAHFGVYDYTAGCSVTAQHQEISHPACDFARHVMQVALAGSGIWLSDGATNVIPAPPHRPPRDPDAPSLTEEQIEENRRAVHRGWRLHYDDVRRSLRHGYYQGWDLNPAQLPTRYAAVYAFFLESLEPAAERLHNFVEMAAQATIVGDVFDDAATGQGLLNFFLRGLNCGAITEEEALATGLTIDEFRSRSFVDILSRRRERNGSG